MCVRGRLTAAAPAECLQFMRRVRRFAREDHSEVRATKPRAMDHGICSVEVKRSPRRWALQIAMAPSVDGALAAPLPSLALAALFGAGIALAGAYYLHRQQLKEFELLRYVLLSLHWGR